MLPLLGMLRLLTDSYSLPSTFYHPAFAIGQDLDRQLVKSNRATVTIPELEFEIPATTQGGVFTTIEGLLTTAAEGLASDQPLRLVHAPEVHSAVAAFLARLKDVTEAKTLPFTIVMDDPSGNSFLENPDAPKVPVRWLPSWAYI